MNYYFETKENERVAEARESFSGRLLTDPQFDEAIAITGIIEREIHKSGSFKDKLGDYAYAFARTEKMDTATAETRLRDLFAARTGQSMNQMREALQEREDKLTPAQKKVAYDYALGVGDLIEKGEKINFNRAFAHQGQELAREYGITDAGAKRLMKEEFKAAENADLYDWGKDLEEKFYRPQIEAEKQRSEERKQDGGRSRANGRSRRSENGRDNGGGSEDAESGERSRSRGEDRPSGEDRTNRRTGFQAPARSRMRMQP